MNNRKRHLVKGYFFFSLFCAVGIISDAFALSPPQLQNLSSDQVDAVLTDFGANLVFRPLEPASPYARIFGFSFGVIGSLTNSSSIKNNISGASGLNYIPDAQIFVGLQGPQGLAAEAGFLPTLSVGGFKVHSIGGDLKWTITETGRIKGRLPIDIALRVMDTSSGISYDQTINGVLDTITYSSNTWGTNLSASMKFSLVEPYLGVGYLHTSSTLSDTGSVTLFQSAVSVTDSFSDSNSGVWIYAGLQFKLWLVNITAEYDDLYGVGAASAKVAFRF